MQCSLFQSYWQDPERSYTPRVVAQTSGCRVGQGQHVRADELESAHHSRVRRTAAAPFCQQGPELLLLLLLLLRWNSTKHMWFCYQVATLVLLGGHVRLNLFVLSLFKLQTPALVCHHLNNRIWLCKACLSSNMTDLAEGPWPNYFSNIRRWETQATLWTLLKGVVEISRATDRGTILWDCKSHQSFLGMETQDTHGALTVLGLLGLRIVSRRHRTR